jgi:3-hydroxyacyl-CoA dehydrogenase
MLNNRDRNQGQAFLPQQAWTVRQIVDALVLPMVNEGVLVLSAGIARRASDIDLAAIHGFGFPRWLGGPMHWAQAEGLPDVVARLDGLARQGLAEPASDVLRDHSQTGQAL